MTTHGPIYQMVEQEIKKTKIKNWNGAGYMLQALEPLLPKIQELETTWIPVEERLPEDNREYLVITEHFNITVASCTGTNWFSYGEYGLYNMKHDYPTHWQPLPLPPK